MFFNYVHRFCFCELAGLKTTANKVTFSFKPWTWNNQKAPLNTGVWPFKCHILHVLWKIKTHNSVIALCHMLYIPFFLSAVLLQCLSKGADNVEQMYFVCRLSFLPIISVTPYVTEKNGVMCLWPRLEVSTVLFAVNQLIVLFIIMFALCNHILPVNSICT